MPRVAPALSLAALALFGSFLAGCGGGSSNSNGCGTHQYSYVGGGIGVSGGADWYSGSYGGGWYDPGDDGTDYGYESSSAGDNGGGGSSGGDDGNYYGDGSGDDGSGDDGSYDDGSGDDGSGDDGYDDGSGDDGSGDDGSGDDGTASKKHLHTANASLHTANTGSHANSCYAYQCDLLCAVGTPVVSEREARGYSALNADDACKTAAHGVETWAHDTLGTNVSACRLAGSDVPASSSSDVARTPASPSVHEGLGSSSSSGSKSTTKIPTIR